MLSCYPGLKKLAATLSTNELVSVLSAHPFLSVEPVSWLANNDLLSPTLPRPVLSPSPRYLLLFSSLIRLRPTASTLDLSSCAVRSKPLLSSTPGFANPLHSCHPLFPISSHGLVRSSGKKLRGFRGHTYTIRR